MAGTRSAVGGKVALAVGAVLVLGAWLQSLVGRPPPRVESPVEQCSTCHRHTTGIEPAHAKLGCVACHEGVASAKELPAAHVGLVRIPGNFADMERTCGAALCHPGVPARLRTNIMSTMNGVVSVDRWVFGAQAGKTAVTPLESLDGGLADLHLRNLCASCHLGAVKAEAGPITERTRGGGCTACHLRYDEAALTSRGAKPPTFAHPRLSARVDDLACFGCHSRSGRVSLNFLGWHEGPSDGGMIRTLEDGRVLSRALPDVHAEAGLRCTDCHGSWEVMGDGRTALHREDQQVVACTDCHRLGAPRTKSLQELDPESQRLARRLGGEEPGRRFVLAEKGNVPLVGAWERDGGVMISGRFSGREHVARAPAGACARTGVHARLACQTCHEAWVPQCLSCHTTFDRDDVMFDLLERVERQGRWIESGGVALAEPAVLGVRELPDGGARIEEFSPGMILRVDPGDAGTPRFHRLFGPVFAHTIRREVRTCTSCHSNPQTLGYGKGRLRLERKGARFTPTFTPARDAGPDGLPEDAWIGFLQSRGSESTTRDDTRPFTPTEQRRVLGVGVCLTCHDERSAELRAAQASAPGTPMAKGPRCLGLR